MWQHYHYKSKSGVTIKSKAKGKTDASFKSIAAADAGLSVEFTRANGIAFSLRKCYQHRIADQFKLARDLLSLPQDAWQRDHAVVTEIVVTGSGTVLISSSRKSRLEIQAKADIGNSIAELANANASLSIALSEDMNTEIVARSGLTPLFKAVRIKESYWTRERRVVPMGGDSVEEPSEEALEEVTYG